MSLSVKYKRELNDALEDLSRNEPGLDRFMAEVLVTELVFGKKSLPGNSREDFHLF